MKRLLFSFALLLTAVGSRASDFEVDGIYYNIIDNGVSVTSGTSKYTGDIVIPESVAYNGNTYHVISIGAEAFNSCSGLTSITIPNSVTTIYDYAFSGCSGLTSVTIPNSVTIIYHGTFSGCSGLTSVTIPNSVTTIYYSAFSGCSGLTSITIPNSVTTIYDGAFEDTGITSFVMSDNISEFGSYVFYNTPWYEAQSSGVIYINDYIVYGYKGNEKPKGALELKQGAKIIANHAFDSCSDLTSITIPNTVINIGNYAFEYCTGLTSIAIPNSVTSIGESAFSGCSSLTSLTLSNSVTCIGNTSFRKCSGLKSIEIPNSVTSIGYSAFEGCISLETITIPESVTIIGNDAFKDCFCLKSADVLSLAENIPFSSMFAGCDEMNTLTITPNSQYYASYENVAFTKDMTEIVWIPNNVQSVDIPESVVSIQNEAFKDCKSLREIVIPNSITSIGDNAFSGCSGLTSLIIPSSVIYMGNQNFSGCDNLTEVEISNSIQNKFNISFSGCAALRKVFLPDNAKILNGAFAYFYQKETQTENVFNDYKDTAPLEELSIGSFTGNIGRIFAYAYSKYRIEKYNCKQGDEVYIVPSNLKLTIRNQSEFDDYALQNTYNLFTIELGKPIEKIGVSSFENSGVVNMVFTENVKTLPLSEFGNQPNLTEFSAKGLEDLESGMFAYCPKLQKLELPFPGPGTKNSTGNFGELFGGKKSNIDGLRDVVQYFENGTSKTYYIPVSLTELVISEGCEIIPYGCLYNCNMLEKITLPTSLYMVGEKALYGCAKVSDIYCKGADPAVAYDSSFEGMRISSCKLHIPYNTAETYKRSTGWKNFYYFEEEAPLDISVTKNIENAGVIYGLNEYQPGQTAELKAVAHSGYTFKGWTENGNTLTTNGTYSFIVTDSRDLTAVFAPVLDENDVEVSAGSETAAVSCQEVEGASSYQLDVYSDADMTIPAGSTSAAAKTTTIQTRAAAATKTLNVGGLNADTRYYYLLTVLSEGGIVLSQFSGSFVTESATGISETVQTAAVTVAERYDASGRRIDAPVKGLNILRMSDGTVRKVLVK